MLKVRFNLREVATIVACLVTTMFTSCGSGEGDNEMELTVQGSGKVMIAIDGYGMASIDWGDGSTKHTHELTGNEKTYEWQYTQASSHTIKITGENITKLALDSETEVELTNLDVSKNIKLTQLCVNGTQLTSLDVSKNTALKILDVSDNQLTSLDVSGQIDLSVLRCKNNKLTIAASNALFETLHNNTVPHPSGFGTAKFIAISNNWETDTFDRSIAEKKGWAFTFN